MVPPDVLDSGGGRTPPRGTWLAATLLLVAAAAVGAVLRHDGLPAPSPVPTPPRLLVRLDGGSPDETGLALSVTLQATGGSLVVHSLDVRVPGLTLTRLLAPAAGDPGGTVALPLALATGHPRQLHLAFRVDDCGAAVGALRRGVRVTTTMSTPGGAASSTSLTATPVQQPWDPGLMCVLRVPPRDDLDLGPPLVSADASRPRTLSAPYQVPDGARAVLVLVTCVGPPSGRVTVHAVSGAGRTALTAVCGIGMQYGSALPATPRQPVVVRALPSGPATYVVRVKRL